MNTNLEEAIRQYGSLDDAAKAQLLGRFCFDLTIEFRSIASEPMVTQSNLERLQGINELQHKALSQMLAHQIRRTDRYPDHVIFTILVEMGRNYGLSGPVQQSLIS